LDLCCSQLRTAALGHLHAAMNTCIPLAPTDGKFSS
jgi:hypothetical protein